MKPVAALFAPALFTDRVFLIAGAAGGVSEDCAALLAHYPQGAHARFIEPAEVAQSVAFLLRAGAQAITGAAMMLDFSLTAGY